MCGKQQRRKQERFTALLHHLTVDLLRDSFFALKRKAASGVDGVTWQEYETGLEDRLVDLHGRVHRGAYRAQPSRRVYIPNALARICAGGDQRWSSLPRPLTFLIAAITAGYGSMADSSGVS